MWLRVPSIHSASLPAREDWTLPSSSLWAELALSALWRSKRLQPPSWRRAWMKARWTTHLSGAMLEPSTAARGVAAFIASLPVIPASLSAPQENERGSTTPDTYGRTSPASSRKSNLRSCSSKTSRDILASDLNRFDETFSTLVIRLRRDCLRRQKLAQGRSASDCSSWPSATAHDAKGRDKPGRQGTPVLASLAEDNWATPNAQNFNDGEDPENWKARQERQKAKGINGNGMGPPIAMQAMMWATPSVADTEGSRKSRSGDRGDELLLNGQAEALSTFLPSLPAPRMRTAGGRLSRATKRLSPRFVEWLMNWPDGWTAFGSVATEFIHWRARMLSELCRLSSRPAVIPLRQTSLLEAMNI